MGSTEWVVLFIYLFVEGVSQAVYPFYFWSLTEIREGFKKSDFYHFGVWPPLESDKNIFYFFGY